MLMGTKRDIYHIPKPYTVNRFENIIKNSMDLNFSNEDMAYFLDNMISIVSNNIENYKIEEIVKGLENINPSIYENVVNSIELINLIYGIIDEVVVEFYRLGHFNKNLTILSVLPDKILYTKD